MVWISKIRLICPYPYVQSWNLYKLFTCKLYIVFAKADQESCQETTTIYFLLLGWGREERSLQPCPGPQPWPMARSKQQCQRELLENDFVFKPVRHRWACQGWCLPRVVIYTLAKPERRGARGWKFGDASLSKRVCTKWTAALLFSVKGLKINDFLLFNKCK